MKFYSALIDKKIMGINVAVEMTVRDYFKFADEIFDNNDLQRSKVKNSVKPYELLEKDLMIGCVIPPIILALSEQNGENKNFISEVIENNNASEKIETINNIIKQGFHDRKVMILDGLQRTYTLKSIIDGFHEKKEVDKLEVFLNVPLRFEVYLGLSKQGILYRMLTLNTGQTPMSFRHQLEILYKNYLDESSFENRIKIYKEVDEKKARGISKYKFSDVIDMFYAFSTGSPMPYDKQALVGVLKELSFLEDYKYKKDSDSMRDLLIVYNEFVVYVNGISEGWEFSDENFEKKIKPFGTNIPSIFAKGQVMAAFGAESKRLIEKNIYKDIEEIGQKINKSYYGQEINKTIEAFLLIISEVGANAKKIGDAQRLYFQLFFRALLSPDFESHLDISHSVYKAQEVFEMMYSA